MAEEKKKQAEVEAKVEEKTEAKPKAEVKAEVEKKAEVKTESKPEGKKDAKPKGEGKKAKGEGKPKGEGKKAKGGTDKAGKGKGKGDKEAKGKKEAKEERPKGPAELELKYRNEVIAALKDQFKYANPMQVPKVKKIVVNTCIKEALLDAKVLETAAKEIATITGQRPTITKAKKSIANFKLRQGQSIGACVTLRGRNMYEFLSRLVNVALPRVRDFKGISSKAFDGRGNYTMGITEQAIFPEINVDKVTRTTGMNITFVTSAKTDDEGKALLKFMGMPFRTEGQ